MLVVVIAGAMALNEKGRLYLLSWVDKQRLIDNKCISKQILGSSRYY